MFESSWKKPYSTRGVRALLARYADLAGLEHNMAPHRLRHFLFTWLKTQGLDDALIQPYSGHASPKSLEIYSRLSLADAQESYDQAISRFLVRSGCQFAPGDTLRSKGPYTTSVVGEPGVTSVARRLSADRVLVIAARTWSGQTLDGLGVADDVHPASAAIQTAKARARTRRA